MPVCGGGRGGRGARAGLGGQLAAGGRVPAGAGGGAPELPRGRPAPAPHCGPPRRPLPGRALPVRRPREGGGGGGGERTGPPPAALSGRSGPDGRGGRAVRAGGAGTGGAGNPGQERGAAPRLRGPVRGGHGRGCGRGPLPAAQGLHRLALRPGGARLPPPGTGGRADPAAGVPVRLWKAERRRAVPRRGSGRGEGTR